jgi:hypothetical protein
MRKVTSIVLPGCSLLCRRLMVCAGLQLSGFRARRLAFARSPKSGRSHTPRVTPEAGISNHRVAWHPDRQPRRIPPHLASRAWRRWANPGLGGFFSPFPLLPPVPSPQYSTTPHEIPRNLARHFPLYGVEADGLSTNTTAHTMHFTGANGANGEVISVSSVSSCSTQATVESILRSFGCRASAREPRPIGWGRVEGATWSCPRDFPAAEGARKAGER